MKTERQRPPVTRFRTVYPLFAGLAVGLGSVSAAGPYGMPDTPDVENGFDGPSIEHDLDGPSIEHDLDDTGVESVSDPLEMESTTGQGLTHVHRGVSRGDGGG